MKYFLPFLILALCQSCQVNKSHSQKSDGPSLVKIWETDTLLTGNESVIYDKASDALYVSCMGNAKDTTDGDGFIAKINLNGEIENLHWVSGLNCPKGLAIYENTLLSIDIDELVRIDMATGKVLSKEKVMSGKLFNDIDVAANGDIFLSEYSEQELVKYKNGRAEVYFSSAETKGLNGVHVADDKLLFTGNNGGIYGISKNLDLEMLADSCFNADGLERYRNGYFCSSWQGKIYYFEEGRSTKILIDTWPMHQYSGDIDVIENKKMLISPTLMNNKVIAYKIVD